MTRLAEHPVPADVGTVLLEHGVLTEKDLRYARRVLAKMDDRQPLGEMLVSLKLIKRAELKKFLRIYKMQLPLGELLVENGVIARAQLEEAQEALAGNADGRIGPILVEKRFISGRDLVKARCEQEDLPFVEPSLPMVDRKLLAEYSLGYLLGQNIIPLARKGGTLQILVGDVPDARTVQEMEGVFQSRLEFSLAVSDQIAKVLQEYRREAKGLSPTGEASGAEVVELADFTLHEAIDMKASDIHFEPLANRLRVRFRIDGVLVHRTDIPKEMETRLIARLKVISELDIAEKRRHQDGRFRLTHRGQDYDFRVSTYVTIHGENVVIRILSRSMGLLDLEELGMPPGLLESYRDFVLSVPAGVAVITGPTGSGKTSTLYSSIDACNDIGLKIITVEDPVEYEIEGIMQCSLNPKAGLTFEDTLKAIVRQDPDIIVLGEIRDRTSASTAIQAALTGHKVFTTFHTEDAVGGLLRLMNMDIETFLISSTVICMVAQRLVRRICEGCRTEASPSPRTLGLLGIDPSDLRGRTFHVGRGCGECHYTGYRGRTAIYELLVLDEKVKDAILERMSSYHIRRISIEHSGLVTLRESGIAKVVQGVTTFEEVLARAPASLSPRPVEQILARIGEEV